MNSGVRIWLSVGAMVMLAGCHSVPFGSLGAPSPKYTNEVGSVRMSVISVGPWDEYVTELQPHYSLDAEGAYAKAIPPTRSTHEGAREHAIASVRVGPSGSDGNGSPNNGPIKEQAIEKADLRDTELVDSRLRYRAATSLYQEVKLLNRQVVDAPVYRGYAAYVVRLQLSVMPRMRHLPYDVYVNLSFFEQQFKDGRYRTLSQLPIVFPLIADDSLEASLNSAALNRIRELGPRTTPSILTCAATLTRYGITSYRQRRPVG